MSNRCPHHQRKPLTPQQAQILRLWNDGRSVSEIAFLLGKEASSVQNQLNVAMLKDIAMKGLK